MFRTDQSVVEVSVLKGESRGYFIAVNHSDHAQHVTISANQLIHAVTRISAEGHQPLDLEGSGWKIDLGPYEGAMVEWKQ